MIDKLPSKLISKDDVNNWDLYSTNLKKYGYIDKYLGNKIETWVRRLENPLELPIIYNLFIDKLNYLDDNLRRLEEYLGKENLEKLNSEIEVKSSSAHQNFQKIVSLEGEIVVYSELKKTYGLINKVEKSGDWETEEKIISVKTITGLDHNYKNIENALRSLSCLEENEIIREKFNHINIFNAESLNYNLLNDLLDFIRKDMLGLLKDLSIIYIQFPEIGIRNEYLREKVKVYIDVFEQYGRRKINFNITSLEKDLGAIGISFTENGDAFRGIISVSYDTNGYYMEEKINVDEIARRIQNIINEINIEYKIDKKFELWVVLYLHDKHSHYIMNSRQELKSELKNKVNYNSLSVFFLIIPELVFDLKQNLKIKLN